MRPLYGIVLNHNRFLGVFALTSLIKLKSAFFTVYFNHATSIIGSGLSVDAIKRKVVEFFEILHRA